MTEQDIPEEPPCIRGCTWDAVGDEPPKPKPQKQGLFCNSCYHRLKHALELIPDLMANMRAQMIPGGAQLNGDRVQGGHDGSPAPLRLDPLDASDSLFAKLVSWTEVIGGKLHIPQPSVAVWINFKEVQGSKPVTVEVAHQLASQLVEWFLVRLATICDLDIGAEFHDDLCYGWEAARGVFALSGSYGVEPRPLREADKRECPVCGAKEVFVAWPSTLNPDIMILCGRCAWVAEPSKYDHYAKLFAA